MQCIMPDLTHPPSSVVHLYSMQITEQLQYIADWLTTQSARRGARAGRGARFPNLEWTVKGERRSSFLITLMIFLSFFSFLFFLFPPRLEPATSY